MSLRCENIDIVFDRYEYLKATGLELEEKKIILLYGPSGCGKTTLFNILAGLIPPPVPENKPAVFWYDHHVKDIHLSNKIRREYISLIYSQFYFLQSLSVEENIILPAVFAKKTKEDIQKKLELLYRVFDFKDIFNYLDLKTDIAFSQKKNGQKKKRFIKDLSNGQKELVGIARAFMLDTPYIFADELLRSYPPQQEQAIWERILSPELGIRKDKTLFMITHKEHFKKDDRIDFIFTIDTDKKCLIKSR